MLKISKKKLFKEGAITFNVVATDITKVPSNEEIAK